MRNRMEYGDIDIMMEGLKLFSLIWEQLFQKNDQLFTSKYSISCTSPQTKTQTQTQYNNYYDSYYMVADISFFKNLEYSQKQGLEKT